jgi:aminoglycoside phosphotransferase (APT) family kinase protein
MARGAHDDVLAGLGEALTAAGHAHGRLFLTEAPHLHARSTIYFVGDAAEPERRCQWVVKRPYEWAGQEDLAAPLDAGRQFEALRVLASHYAPMAPELRVPRPVAFLADLEAFAMEYAKGTSVDGLVRPRRLIGPEPLLDGVALSARFLRHLHALEAAGPAMIRPRALAEEVLTLEEETMRPAGLALPAELREALEAVSAVEVRVQTVRLHGDFAPVNMIIDRGTSVTGIDVTLAEFGIPEDDLARFAMMLATERLFLASSDVASARELRRRAEAVLLETYYGEPSTSDLLELRVIQQLCRRWLRRHTARIATRPWLAAARKRLVDRYFETLLAERARLLTAGRDSSWVEVGVSDAGAAASTPRLDGI